MSLIYKGQTIADVGGSGGGGGVPKGTIVIWSGAADAIPSGWALCDGTNGTPNLSGRFVFGAGGDVFVGVETPFGSSGTKYLYYTLCYIMKITDGGGSGSSGGSSEEIYSTEEVRIGTWVDGKPLYRKMSSTVVVVEGVNVLIPVSELPNIDVIASTCATLINTQGTNNNYITLPYVSSDSNGAVTASGVVSYSGIRGLQVSLFKLNNFSAFGWIEYTKTTDTGGTT